MTTVETFWKTGINQVDELLGGFPIGKTVYLTGRRGSGKTEFSALISGNLQKITGRPVLFVSSEETHEATSSRFNRLGFGGNGSIHLLCKRNVKVVDIAQSIKWANPCLTVVDSVLELGDSRFPSDDNIVNGLIPLCRSRLCSLLLVCPESESCWFPGGKSADVWLEASFVRKAAQEHDEAMKGVNLKVAVNMTKQ